MQGKTLLPVMAAAILLSACATTTRIGRINADPTRYRNRTVQVTGTVVNSFGVLGTGGYQIEDPTGKIIVISSSGVPSKGSRVRVTGTVMEGVTAMGRSFGSAIREERHRVESR